MFSLPHVWAPIIFLNLAIEPEILKPFLHEKLQLDLFQDTAWIALAPSFTQVKFEIFGGNLLTIQTKELQILTYASFGEKKGYFPLQIDFDSRLLSLSTDLTMKFPFGSKLVKVEGEFKEDQFTFSSTENGDVTYEFNIKASKGIPLEKKGLVQFALENRTLLFSATDDEAFETTIEGLEISEIYSATISSFSSNYIKNHNLGDFESSLNINNLSEGQAIWLDKRSGDVQLEEKLPSFLFSEEQQQ